jgi:hypothetical protein
LPTPDKLAIPGRPSSRTNELNGGQQSRGCSTSPALRRPRSSTFWCVIPVVGLPCVVAAAPKLALALGYDLDEALE